MQATVPAAASTAEDAGLASAVQDWNRVGWFVDGHGADGIGRLSIGDAIIARAEAAGASRSTAWTRAMA
ncbi:MAG: hypothetical protein ACOCXJ_07420 [Planctomycetota bacterium]